MKNLSRLALLNFILMMLMVVMGLKATESKVKGETVAKANQAGWPTAAPTTAVNSGGQVAEHNSMADCWVIYAGGVFDISKFFGQHPGGDAIIARYCGRDMTWAFNTMEKMGGKSHSQKARQMLESYRIK